MRFLIGFVNFWYDFIVGDDWTIAAGVIIALAIAAGLVQLHLTIWWWMPLIVALLLTASLWRLARTAKPLP